MPLGLTRPLKRERLLLGASPMLLKSPSRGRSKGIIVHRRLACRAPPWTVAESSASNYKRSPLKRCCCEIKLNVLESGYYFRYPDALAPLSIEPVREGVDAAGLIYAFIVELLES